MPAASLRSCASDGPFECASKAGLVLIEFVEHHLVAVVVREQNVELKGARFILKAAGCMRPQQRQELVPAPGRNFNRRNERKLRHSGVSISAPATRSAKDHSVPYPPRRRIGAGRGGGPHGPLAFRPWLRHRASLPSGQAVIGGAAKTGRGRGGMP